MDSAKRDAVMAKPYWRTVSFKRDAMTSENRVIDIAFSSEEPYERWWGVEILDHSEGACDLSRLLNRAPLLKQHNPECQIGVVETASVDADRVGRCSVRFSRGEEGEEVYQDVIDQIVTKCSVGYNIRGMVQVMTPDGKPQLSESGEEIYRVTSWMPFEVSLVSIAADDTVGVGRSMEDVSRAKIKEMIQEELGKCEPITTQTTREDTTMSDTAAVTVATPSPDEVRQNERERMTEINAIAERFDKLVPKMSDLRSEAIQKGWTKEAFANAVLERMNAKPVNGSGDNASTSMIGMSDREIQRYSLVKAMRTIADHGTLDGLEREASDAAAKLARREPKGFFVPEDMMRAQTRALASNSATGGGYTVGTDTLGGSMIELLRNKTKVIALGAKTLGGLTGNIAIPRVTGGATAYWLPETGQVTASDQAFGQLGLVPHRLVGDTAYTKELLIQSSIDVEGYVREDLMKVLAIAKDWAAIQGLGAAGQPQGIANTANVGSVTFGAAATWPKVVDFETQVSAANADAATMAYLISPATRGKWKGAVKISGSQYSDFLFEKSPNAGWGGMVNGYRAEVTAQLTSGTGGSGVNHQVIFGNWEDLILADWAGIDVVVDPYSLKKYGQIEVTVTVWTDIGIRHAASFCVSSDSGAQ